MKHGANVVSGDVKDVTAMAGGYRVRTDRDDHEAEIVLLAKGPWVGDVLEWLGVALPVTPEKGELLRLRLPGPNIAYDLTHEHISLYRRGDGEVWVGVTRQPGEFDEQPSDWGRQYLLEGAAKILPAIAGAQLIEHLASVRPVAPGGLPLVGVIPDHPNLYVANGGGHKGMLLSAGVGRALCDLILNGSTTVPIPGLNLLPA
jgi:glycine oxidase